MKKIGILGVSEGNGHPYSFSAIINGYDDENFKKQNGMLSIIIFVREIYLR